MSHLDYRVDSRNRLFFESAKIKLAANNGYSAAVEPTVEITENELRLGCYTITRGAFEYLAREWQAFLDRGNKKVLQP